MDFTSLAQTRPETECRLPFPMEIATGLRQEFNGTMQPAAKPKPATHLGTRLGRAMNAEGCVHFLP